MASDIVELQQAASTSDVHGNGGGVKGLGSETNPSEVVGRNFELAAGRLGLSLEQRVLLKTPFREVRVEVPVRMTGLMERQEEAAWMLRAVLDEKSASSRELRVSVECRSSENQVER